MPHGGYPTPSYEDAPMRRRLTSQRIYGHPGAHVALAAEAEMRAAGEASSLEEAIRAHPLTSEPQTAPSEDGIAERLKDVAGELGAYSLRASIPTARDEWVSVEVAHAWPWGDSRDGWDVTIERGGL